MHRRLKPEVKLAVIIIAIILLLIIVSCFIYKINIGRVSKNDELREITIETGNSYMTIADTLKENNLIKSELFYKIYIKLHKPTSLQAGKYELSENMNVKQIVNALSNGSTYNPNVSSVTFKEGINMRSIASIIANNTNNTEEDVYTTLKDTSYLDELIQKYWFITDSIKNKGIYYSLEGYLFPNTYSINKNSSVKEIFNIMLDNTSKKLGIYKEQIETNGYSAHELLTLASIVELEAANSNDRAGVAGVFRNRLTAGWSLGSDVTTYYGIKVDMSERDLYLSEINEVNSYNTRSEALAGKLPIGPICIPGIDSISAAINPVNHDYYYFVADKNKKTYFSKTANEHDSTVASLKEQGLWYEY